jgi:hypothetical protein
VLPAGESFHVPIEELRQNRFIVGDPAYCIEHIELHRERLGIQERGFRLHWPGMPHDRVLRAIALLGERVLPHFAWPRAPQRARGGRLRIRNSPLSWACMSALAVSPPSKKRMMMDRDRSTAVR